MGITKTEKKYILNATKETLSEYIIDAGINIYDSFYIKDIKAEEIFIYFNEVHENGDNRSRHKIEILKLFLYLCIKCKEEQ